MIVLKPRVHALFTSSIKRLTDAGVSPTPEEILWIHALSEKAVRPDRLSTPAFLDSAIKVGRVWLYPPSIQAYMWLDEYALKWWKKSPSMTLWSIAFGMAYSKTHDVFPKLTSRKRAYFIVRKWSFLNLTISRNALADAIDALTADEGDYEEIPPHNKKRIQVESTEWGDIITMLCGAYHRPPEDFLWKVSTNTCLAMIAKAPLPQGYERPTISSAEVQALFELRMTLNEIERRHKTEEADGEQ